MNVVTAFTDLGRQSERTSCVALGIFDGVHVGHAALLTRCVKQARAGGHRAVALTFSPHPAKLLRAEAAPASIESLELRLHRFAALGLDAAWVVPFDHALAAMSAEAFVHTYLGDGLHARDVVVGYDFVFGRKQGGNAELLRKLGARGIGAAGTPLTTHALAAVHVGDVVASSSTVRARIGAADFAGAAAVLGRPYCLYGEVEHGLQRGRTLGFPTANLRQSSELVPPHGIYAAWATGPLGRLAAAVSIGVHPTFEAAPKPKIEAYLLDYRGPEFYGTPMQLQFVTRLRGEQKFSGIAPLVAQMHRDCARARVCLGLSEPTA